MKLWHKLEDKLNRLIGQILAIFTNRILASKKFRGKDKSAGLYGNIQESLTSSKQAISWYASKLNPIRLLGFLPELIASSFQLVGLWLSSLRHLDVIVVSVILFLSVKITYDKYKMLKQSVTMKMNSEGMNSRYTPLTRSVYHKKYDKQFTMYSIKVPIFRKNNIRPKQIIMDFTVETSNKYLKEYLGSKIYLVQDRFNITIEPIISELPLKKEGKTILAKKLKRELNKLIKNLKIKGQINRVYIHSILVS